MNTQSQKLAFILTKVSLFIWFLSLFLTFTLNALNNVSPGYEMVLLGTLFFWLNPLIFSVFSTYFYLYAVYVLLRGLKPVTSVIMMVISGFLLVIVILLGKLKTQYGAVEFTSWGWSPICMLVSYALVVLATLLQQDKIKQKTVNYSLGAILAIVFLLALLGNYQRQHANEIEKKRYFPRIDVLYTLKPLSELPYVNKLEEMPEDLQFELILPKELPDYIKNELFNGITSYWENGQLLQWYNLSNLAVTNLKSKNSTPKYRLAVAEPKSRHYLFTLSYIKTGKIIYQQTFISPKNNQNTNEMIPPLYELPNAIDKMYRLQEPMPLHAEKGEMLCPIIAHHKQGDDEKEWQWESLLLRANYDDDNIPTYDFRPDKTICSQSYMLAIRSYQGYVRYGYLFERSSGLLIDFLGGNTKDIKTDDVTQFEINPITVKIHNERPFELILTTREKEIKF